MTDNQTKICCAFMCTNITCKIVVLVCVFAVLVCFI